MFKYRLTQKCIETILNFETNPTQPKNYLQMKKQLFIFAIIILIFTGCSKDYELKKSVFINDKEFPSLPIYSEWGYNTFGAYYDREVFVSNDISVPAKVSVSNNEMSFILDGQKEPDTYDSRQKMVMTFKISDFLPEEYTNLTTLNDTILDLTNPAYQVLISMDNTTYTANILSGKLTFKRAQNLLVDKKQVEVILSGYFEFKAIINEKTVTVSDGRFDVGISSDNFYIY